MSAKHLLIKKAFIYDGKREINDPENCEFDNKLGMWLWGDKKEILVKSENPFKPLCGTKKADIETGEDAKGE